jgi:hypothetical protein
VTSPSEAYAAAHGWEQVALLHSLGSLINHAVAGTTPAQAMRAQSQMISTPGSATDAILLERRRRGVCLLIEHMNEHARDRAERRVCRQRLRQQRADRLAAAVMLCERWVAVAPHTPAVINLLSEALAIANSQHEIRENVLLRSGCFPHIRLSLEAGAEAQQQLALALVRALCTSRHNRRELRRAGVIPPLVMLLLPSVAVQQQAGAAAALLALVQGDRIGSGTHSGKACNVPNLKLLADYPDAVARLEAVASGSKTVDTLFGLSSKVGMRDAGISSSDSKQEGASCAAPAGTHLAVGGLASISTVNNHEVASSTNMCDMKTGAPDLNADSASSSTTPAPAPVVCKLERVDSAAASSAAAAFAAADATAILSLIRFTLPQAITARSKSGSVIHSDPDAHAPPLPGESSGASHTSRYASTQLLVVLLSSCSFKPSSFSPSLLLLLSDGTKQRRSVSLQEAKRMLADIVSQSRATAAIGGCAGAAGPSTQLPS